jgi:phosphatidylethanolamine/phosphatidyl-N-methylethanolamine N-methyltransferase
MDDASYESSARNRRKSDPVAFFLGFLRRPASVGSLVPSSRFLERRLVEAAAVETARLVVELGPGTGGTTRALLARLPQDARLLAIELDPEFVARLAREPDPRLIVHLGSAEQLSGTLERHGLPAPDVVISGIPFSTMPAALGKRILAEVWACLAPGGRFVAYQFRDRVAVLGRKLFGSPDIKVELLNAPPMRVYRWRKPAAQASVAPA